MSISSGLCHRPKKHYHMRTTTAMDILLYHPPSSFSAIFPQMFFHLWWKVKLFQITSWSYTYVDLMFTIANVSHHHQPSTVSTFCWWFWFELLAFGVVCLGPRRCRRWFWFVLWYFSVKVSVVFQTPFKIQQDINCKDFLFFGEISDSEILDIIEHVWIKMYIRMGTILEKKILKN